MAENLGDCLFPSLYSPDARDAALFGDHYAPPERFSHGGWHKVAEFPKTAEDGQPCEIYECRYPARFFKLVALESRNSIDEPKTGFALSTGSGDEVGALMVALATQIAGGMVGLSKNGD